MEDSKLSKIEYDLKAIMYSVYDIPHRLCNMVWLSPVQLYAVITVGYHLGLIEDSLYKMDLNSTKDASFNFDLKFLRTYFSANFWALSEPETFSRNVESWRLNAAILSLKCDTWLSGTSWSYLLLINSFHRGKAL